MPERSSYAPGTPSWADLSSPDVKASVSYYDALFGWKAIETGSKEETGGYRMFLLGGKPVAGIGSLPPDGQPPVWATYVTVDDAEATAAKVVEAGGNTMMPPMDVLTAGRMAVFADPEGAVFCVWQPRDHKGAAFVREHGALSWVELGTRDPDSALAFYKAVFGWEADAGDLKGESGYALWRLDGEPVAGIMAIGDRFPEDVPPHWMTYFGADDVDALAAKGAEVGGQIVVEPRAVNGTRFAVLADPIGSVFGIISLEEQATESE